MAYKFSQGEAPEKPSRFIKYLTLEAQDHTKIKHQQQLENEHRRQQQAAEGQAAADFEMPQAPPPPVDVDTQLLRQMFATMIVHGRDMQQLQQSFGALTTTIQQV